MDLERHWRAVRRQRKRIGRAYAAPQVARDFRAAVKARLPVNWQNGDNRTLAALLNGLDLMTFEGRAWDAQSARTFRLAVDLAATKHAALVDASRKADHLAVKRRLARLAANSTDMTYPLDELLTDLTFTADLRQHPDLGDLAERTWKHAFQNYRARRGNEARADVIGSRESLLPKAFGQKFGDHADI